MSRIITVSILAILFMVCTVSCSSTTLADDAPLHQAFICPPGDGSCSESERLSAFNRWVESGIERSGSTFVVWRAGQDRSASRLETEICIPMSWGGGVMERKTVFINEARNAVKNGRSFPMAGCSASVGQDSSEGTRLLSVQALNELLRSASIATVPSSEPQALHAAIVCDVSDSTLGKSCTNKELVDSYFRWASRSGLIQSGSFSVYLVGRTSGQAERVFSFTFSNSSLGERATDLLGAAKELSSLELNASKVSSAIAETVYIAGSQLQERPGRHTLTVLSDLRQVTPGRWNFEKSIPAPRDFVTWLGSAGLLHSPVLSNTSLEICGLHTQNTTINQINSLRETWEAAFRAMGGSPTEITSNCQPNIVSSI